MTAAPQQRRESRYRRQRGGHREHHDQALVERRRDESGEEFPAGEDLLAGGREGGQHVARRQQVLYGIDPQHGGAIGRLSPQVLHLSTQTYDASVHYQQVRDNWVGVSAPDGR